MGGIEDLLIKYGPMLGYIILLLGSFIEGESVVLTAGFLAYKGYLYLPYTMAIAFLGSTFADQMLFFLGRHYGPRLLNKKPAWKVKMDKAFNLLHKYNVWFIMGFRFIYGIRTVSPFVIGASKISIKRFAILNIIAALIWAIISCGAGYLLGYFFADQIDIMIEKLIGYQKIVILCLLAIIGLAIYRKYQKRKNF